MKQIPLIGTYGNLLTIIYSLQITQRTKPFLYKPYWSEHVVVTLTVTQSKVKRKEGLELAIGNGIVFRNHF